MPFLLAVRATQVCTSRRCVLIVSVHVRVVCACCSTEHFMSQFLIVPYSLLPGHNAKTIPHISAEHCAQLCVHDDNIVCRSFDYHVSSFLQSAFVQSSFKPGIHAGPKNRTVFEIS